MLLKLILGSLELQRLIAMSLSHIDLHRLAVQLEAVHFQCGIVGRLLGIVDDEGLAPALQAGLGFNVDDVAVVLEDGHQGLLERLELYILVEILDLGG